ncbi:fluoride efflux transporter FluC [Alicyclobacillus tolerans]|uniref:Fluoride-specific ion channel FluC n=1 Tax=Alicyclobacillus tolerans TaxID=90970 RepID=A0A1M6VTR1_9BACL|nr:MULTISPECIES: CrcB family protein [Alicyclobacillus]SHK84893.1 CrcB protein [Alicyclobacillus montanus]
MKLGAIVTGAIIGGVLRFCLSVWIPTPEGFPLGILFINLSGSLLLGAFQAYVAQKSLPEWLILGLSTGCIGTYTTFSSYCLGVQQLAIHHLGWAVFYALGSLIAGPLTAFFGEWMVNLSVRKLHAVKELSV